MGFVPDAQWHGVVLKWEATVDVAASRVVAYKQWQTANAQHNYSRCSIVNISGALQRHDRVVLQPKNATHKTNKTPIKHHYSRLLLVLPRPVACAVLCGCCSFCLMLRSAASRESRFRLARGALAAGLRVDVFEAADDCRDVTHFFAAAGESFQPEDFVACSNATPSSFSSRTFFLIFALAGSVNPANPPMLNEALTTRWHGTIWSTEVWVKSERMGGFKQC